MVIVLDPGSSDPGLSPGWGNCVEFLGKTSCSHSTSLHPGSGEFTAGRRGGGGVGGESCDGLASHPWGVE